MADDTTLLPRDLALSKPATASSVYDRPGKTTPQQDARGANAATLAEDYGFHTEFETDPWWMVDLVNESLISELRIVNRAILPERFASFQILSSRDGTEWSTRYVHADSAPVSHDPDDPWCVDFPEAFAARYVKIALIGEGWLHLRRVQIFGTPIPAAAPLAGHRSLVIPTALRAADLRPGIRIGLVGNCQMSALLYMLSRARRVRVSAVCDVNLQESQYFTESRYLIETRSDVDYVVSHQLGASGGEVANDRLREIYGERLLTATNFYFSGLHPDITYVGAFGKRLQSAMGDYHSKIVLYAYLRKLSPAECLALFRHRTYAALGYYDEYASSMAELERRDATNALRLAGTFRDMTRQMRTMLTVNHPTQCALLALARAIVAHFGDDPADLAAEMCNNPIGEGNVWPIYPELREYHALPYETPMCFYPEARFAQPVMDLREFIETCYRIYDGYGAEQMAASDAAQTLMHLEL